MHDCQFTIRHLHLMMRNFCFSRFMSVHPLPWSERLLSAHYKIHPGHLLRLFVGRHEDSGQDADDHKAIPAEDIQPLMA